MFRINYWEVTQEAIDINRQRIQDRMPVNAKFTERKIKINLDFPNNPCYSEYNVNNRGI